MLIMKLLLPILTWPVEWLKNGPKIGQTEWTLWVASDPLRDSEVAKIDPACFYSYMLSNVDEADGYKEVAKLILFLRIHAGKSCSRSVIWTKVMARLTKQNFAGISVKRLKCLQSLVYWILRNTGHGSPISNFRQERLLQFIFANKLAIFKMLRNFKQKLLIQYLTKISKIAGTTRLNWYQIIPYLVRRRGLFSCKKL
ncbi:uncharacterized protein LOC141854773 [Brevipalpus obovatus]|uniref:uncharacterized protein LOC141854773 n=1 Tax=Brevipalpus obovatus TaxID=246614 RepID=UPI003D9DCE0B